MERINLQLFAEEPGEDDTLDEDMLAEEEEELDLKSLFDEEEAEEEATGEQEAEETQAETQEAPEAPPQEKSGKVTFTPEQQAELDRIIGERLARDRRDRADVLAAVQELERVAGMSIRDILNYAKENRVRAVAEEKGITEEEARELLRKEEELEALRARTRSLEEQQEAIRRVQYYNYEKSKYLNDPLVRKYEKEIDDFAEGGLRIPSFEVAMHQVLGQKLASGELREAIATGAEKKAMANFTKRSKVAPERGSQAGEVSSISALSPSEKRIVMALGISPKDYLSRKPKKR